MEWSETIVDKQTVKPNSTVQHTFTYNGDKKINKIVPLCSCIKTSVLNNDYTFRIKIKSKFKSTVYNKMIEVRYSDGTRSYLIIKYKVSNEN